MTFLKSAGIKHRGSRQVRDGYWVRKLATWYDWVKHTCHNFSKFNRTIKQWVKKHAIWLACTDWILLELLNSLAMNEMVKHISACSVVHYFLLVLKHKFINQLWKDIPSIWLYITCIINVVCYGWLSENIISRRKENILFIKQTNANLFDPQKQQKMLKTELNYHVSLRYWIGVNVQATLCDITNEEITQIWFV